MSNISIRIDPDPLDIAALEQHDVEFELSDHVLTMDEDSYQSLLDVAKHGALGGFSGFIYHSELYEFVCKNQKKLVEALKQDASDCGEGLFEYIKQFNFLKQNYDSSDVETELAETLFGTPDIELGTINSVLGWYALERIAYKVESADIDDGDDDDGDDDDDDDDDDSKD